MEQYMPRFNLPYGKGFLEADIPDRRLLTTLTPTGFQKGLNIEEQREIVRSALARPVDSPLLSELSAGKENVVIIASDHTRPVPSKIIMPPMLVEIRKGSPGANITILIATGAHRKTTHAELTEKFGDEIVNNEKIMIHDCDDRANLVNLGKLPSGGDLWLNKTAAEADLLVSEGFIEPHFFAGFSGGRKSVLPGIAGRETVAYNHNSEFIDSPFARAGITENNPIHIDMAFAARVAKLRFICNVVLNNEKEIVFAAAGDCDKAHRRGVDFLKERCGVGRAEADIVITTNGGCPLDQNIYQAVKGMTAAERCVREGGVIIMLAKSDDGHGGESFYKTFNNARNLDSILENFRNTPRNETAADQWQSQIFARVLKRARVVYISDAPHEIVRGLRMTLAHSVEAAVDIADGILWEHNRVKPGDGKIIVIPDGISVIVS